MEDEELKENEVINEEEIVDEEEISEEEVDNEDTSEEIEEEDEQEEERLFTQEEVQEQVDKAVQSKLFRERKKYNKEREDTERLVDMLKIGTGKENINDIYDEMSDFYKERGYDIPDRAVRRDEEERVLGKHDAEEIISLGTEDISETLRELSNKKRTVREEETFKVLSVQLSKDKAKESLESMGVDTSILEDKKFQDFASKFSSTTPITEIYDFYNSTKGIKKDKPKSMGSVKNSKSNVGEIKDFYTKEEAEKFTLKDFDKNPKLYEAIEKSASKW